MVDQFAGTAQRLGPPLIDCIIGIPGHRYPYGHTREQAAEEIINPDIGPKNLAVRSGNRRGIESRLEFRDFCSRGFERHGNLAFL